MVEKTTAVSQKVYDWSAAWIVENEEKLKNHSPFSAMVEFARALFNEFGVGFDDNRYLHFLKALYEEKHNAK